MSLAATIVLVGLIAEGVTLAPFQVGRPSSGPTRRPALAVGLVILALCAVVVLVAVTIGVALGPP